MAAGGADEGHSCSSGRRRGRRPQLQQRPTTRGRRPYVRRPLSRTPRLPSRSSSPRRPSRKPPAHSSLSPPSRSAALLSPADLSLRRAAPSNRRPHSGPSRTAAAGQRRGRRSPPARARPDRRRPRPARARPEPPPASGADAVRGPLGHVPIHRRRRPATQPPFATRSTVPIHPSLLRPRLRPTCASSRLVRFVTPRGGSSPMVVAGPLQSPCLRCHGLVSRFV
ncbi:hypothetical protein ACP70R_011754 [Stipagrostis hirtigluma subsp. patula]